MQYNMPADASAFLQEWKGKSIDGEFYYYADANERTKIVLLNARVYADD